MIQIVLLLLTLQTQAAWLPDLETPLKCTKEISAALKTVFAEKTPVWTATLDADINTKVFRASTQIGEWVEFFSSTATTRLVLISTEKSKSLQWDNNCKMTEKISGGMQFSSPQPKSAFQDSDLKKILASQKKGIFYLWSPRMVYSVTEFQRYAETAQKLGLEFIPLLDPNVSSAEARASLQKIKPKAPNRKLASQKNNPFDKKMQSLELYMRNGTLHFPSVFVFNNGQLHPERLIGVLSPFDLENLIQTRLKDLK